jgi:hypothetical protein
MWVYEFPPTEFPEYTLREKICIWAFCALVLAINFFMI